MPVHPTPGRAWVSRRAVVDVVRTATLGSYGVTGFAASWPVRIVGLLGIGQPGIRVAVGDAIEVDLDITVAHGLPIAEVARQVDSAVRYAARQALGREVDRLTINIGGLRLQPSGPPIAPPPPATAIVPPQPLARAVLDGERPTPEAARR